MVKWLRPKPRIIEAEAIILRDKQGTNRAMLTTATGTPAMFIYDSEGVARLEMSLGLDDAPTLTFYDSKGTTRMLWSLQEDDPQVTLWDADGLTVIDSMPQFGE